eukprot:5111794-Pleurochrysis_carterae.AAC.1
MAARKGSSKLVALSQIRNGCYDSIKLQPRWLLYPIWTLLPSFGVVTPNAIGYNAMISDVAMEADYISHFDLESRVLTFHDQNSVPSLG